MITLKELLEDPLYKKFFYHVPKNEAKVASHTIGKPYRVWVKLKSRKWKFKDCDSYSEALALIEKLLPQVLDGAINCPSSQTPQFNKTVRTGEVHSNGTTITKRVPWLPPLPSTEGPHTWCTYCRRPTVFQTFKRHHALPLSKTAGMAIDTTIARCTICGASERINQYYASQRADTHKTKKLRRR